LRAAERADFGGTAVFDFNGEITFEIGTFAFGLTVVDDLNGGFGITRERGLEGGRAAV
jgi:hypothetical protein